MAAFDLNDTWDQIDAAGLEDDPQRAAEILRGAVAALEEIAKTQPAAEVFHALGYAWYIHPEHASSETVQDLVDTYFRRALEVDPGYELSRLYLGYNAYDRGRLTAAREAFASTNAERLNSFFSMKVYEMRVCCAIRCDGLLACLDMLAEFVARCEAADVVDVDPSTLAEVLALIDSSEKSAAGERLLALAERLDEVVLGSNWFLPLVRSGGNN